MDLPLATCCGRSSWASLQFELSRFVNRTQNAETVWKSRKALRSKQQRFKRRVLQCFLTLKVCVGVSVSVSVSVSVPVCEFNGELDCICDCECEPRNSYICIYSWPNKSSSNFQVPHFKCCKLYAISKFENYAPLRNLTSALYTNINTNTSTNTTIHTHKHTPQMSQGK